MGGAVSSGRDNNELVDNLMSGGYIRTRTVERVFRVLDRGDFITPAERDLAYKDLAWRSGALHLSAPCIYSEVVEGLELKPGMSFLNLGSGTGYLSTLVGLIISSSGISHGVEIHPGVVEYSSKKRTQFLENSVTLDEFDFCQPKYYCGNALSLAPLQSLYDRVYVGAGVLPKYENYFKQLIKVGGILVMPLGDTLVQIIRTSEAEWNSRQLLNVSFALMREPTKEEVADPIKLDELTPVSLVVLCRGVIRRAMRGGVCRRHPELREPVPKRPPAPRSRPRRICIPLDPDTDDPSLNELHDMNAEDGGREMNALLSLVLSMGNNRVAGSLRFDEDDVNNINHRAGVEVLINEAHESSSDSEWTESPSLIPSGSGAANAAPAVRAALPGAAPAERAAATHALPEPEDAPRSTPGDTDLSALTQAGPVECALEQEVSLPTVFSARAGSPVDDSSSDGSKPSTSGRIPAVPPPFAVRGAPSGGGGGGGNKRSGGGERRRRARRALASSSRHARSRKRFPREVSLYLGVGPYARSDEVAPDAEEARAASAAEEPRAPPYSDSDDEPRPASETKRQKLDSGIGEGTASTSSSQTTSPMESDAGRDSSYTDASATDNQESRAGRGRARRGGYDSDTSAAEGGASARSASARRERRRSQRDARRVRLSISMKRAIKELPLPYALKKYINYHRCFEF